MLPLIAFSFLTHFNSHLVNGLAQPHPTGLVGRVVNCGRAGTHLLQSVAYAKHTHSVERTPNE